MNMIWRFLSTRITTPVMVLAMFSAPVIHAQVHEYKLENGLTLLVKEDHRAPVVVSQVWYKVGSSYEHDGITGISHALEHMMFKGTEAYPEGEFSRIISENGGRDNAFTSMDYTAYFQILEKSRLNVSFELEADRMRNLILSDDEFKKEIEVVKEERRLRTEDNPVAYLYELTRATAFQTSPYRHPIVGWMSDLDAMQTGDLETWYQRWYAPNNATVVVVGDVEHEEVYALARQYFAPLKAERVIPPRAMAEVRQQGIKEINLKRAAELPYLLMAYKAPSLSAYTHPQDGMAWEPYALEVLDSILDGGSSARLAANLVRGQEVAASVGVSYYPADRLAEGLFTIQAVPAKNKTIAEVEQAIREQIKTLKEEPVTEEELLRVKAQVVSSNVYGRDSLFYQARLLGVYETVGLGWRKSEEYVEQVQKITADQLMQVANKYFHDDGLTRAVLEPQPIERKQPAGLKQGGGRHAR